MVFWGSDISPWYLRVKNELINRQPTDIMQQYKLRKKIYKRNMHDLLNILKIAYPKQVLLHVSTPFESYSTYKTHKNSFDQKICAELLKTIL